MSGQFDRDLRGDHDGPASYDAPPLLEVMREHIARCGCPCCRIGQVVDEVLRDETQTSAQIAQVARLLECMAPVVLVAALARLAEGR